MKMSILNNLKDFFIPAEVEDDNDTGYKQETSEQETGSSYTSSVSSSSSKKNPSNFSLAITISSNFNCIVDIR